LKIAFNILPVSTEYERMHLLITMGDYGASFVWFSKDPCNIRGLAVYNLTDESSPGIIAEKIYNILYSSSIFDKQYASVTVCYDFKESLLVPEAYYDPATAGSLLNLVYAAGAESDHRKDVVNGFPVFNVYAVDKRIENVFTGKFPGAIIYHASSLEIKNIAVSSEQTLHCSFFHNSIKVILFNRSDLQLVKHFNYNSPIDAAYHLLNCCEQHSIKPAEVELVMSGMIDEKSKLYNELYRYFLNIQFEKQQDSIELHDRIKFYPSHFFSHLTGLALCVS